MRQKDKQLLLKDLCARLPYGLKVNIERDFPNNPQIVERIAKDGEIIVNGIFAYDIYYYKPYLRPMSSMTEEEKLKYITLTHYNTDDEGNPYRELTVEALDWLNENHIDYRGLIPMGLALEAPKGMYKKLNR